MLGFPGCQNRLIEQLVALGKPVVVVMMNGGALTPNNTAGAIIDAFYPGQAGGQAIADVVFGRYNPAGRLPYTVYQHGAQLPSFTNYSMRASPGWTYSK